MTGMRPFRDLFATAMSIVAVWVVVALFNSSESYRGFIVTGHMPEGYRPIAKGEMPYQLWPLLTYYQLAVGLLWATFTPVIIFIAERLPLVRPFRWRNTVAVLAVTPLIALCRAAFGGAVLYLVEGGRSPDGLLAFVAFSVNARFHRNVLITLVVFGIFNLLVVYRAAAASETEMVAAGRQLANEELQRLRGALQPRFFFGALGAVKRQMAAAPLVADRMLVQFGAVLRKMLELEERADVSLAEELAVVQQCLALEATRTCGRFAWQIAADESILAARVPPLVLHTIVAAGVMVEGADRGKLEIEASQSGETLNVSITFEDTSHFAGCAALETARARLRRLFGDRASLEVRNSSGPEAVVVTMPFIVTAIPARGFRL